MDQKAPISKSSKNSVRSGEKNISSKTFSINLELAKNHAPSDGLSSLDVQEARKIHGYNEVTAKQKPEWRKVVERYTRIVPALLLVAAIFSVAVEEDGIRDWVSFGMLLFLCNVMVWADYMGERSANDAISAVEKLGAPECLVKRDGEYITLPVRELVPGDVIALKAGCVLPADGVYLCKNSHVSVDESPLTGECLAVTKQYGDELLSGSIIQNGSGEMLVRSTGANSFYGKTILLLARAERPGNLRLVLEKAANVITCVAVLFAIFILFWQAFSPEWKVLVAANWEWILLKRAFVLVASVAPAAMPVVTTTVLAVGALAISRENGIVSRLSAIEEAAGVTVLCSDKTGTLTLNKLTLNREETVCGQGYSMDKVILYASLASTLIDAEAIDKEINEACDMQERSKYVIENFTPFNPVDKRAQVSVIGPNGKKAIITKGAPHVIRDLVCRRNSKRSTNRSDVGLDNIAQEKMETLYSLVNGAIEDKAKRGFRTLGIAVQEGGAWEFVGLICFFDPPREDTAETIQKAKKMGVCVKMITGDQQAIARETARILGIGDNIAGPDIFETESETSVEIDSKNGDEVPRKSEKSIREYVDSLDGFSGVYPEHKYAIVDALQEGGQLVAMTGDGVNDAPALKRAAVGIAVSGATGAARAAADIILLAPGLSAIITVLRLSRQIFKRVESYITFRISTSMLVLLFWWSCIVIYRYPFPSWVLVLVSMINDFVLMSCAHDNVPSSKTPLVWSMLRITLAATWLAIVGAISIVVYIALSDPAFKIDWWTNMWNVETFKPDWEQPEHQHTMSYQTNAGVWLLLTLIIQFKFHSCRTQGFFFKYNDFENKFPALAVLIPQTCAIILTVFLCVYWHEDWVFAAGARVHQITWAQAGITTLWAIIWFLLMDCTKVLFYKFVWPRLESTRLIKKIKSLSRYSPKKEMLYRHRIKMLIREIEYFHAERQKKKERNSETHVEKRLHIPHTHKGKRSTRNALKDEGIEKKQRSSSKLSHIKSLPPSQLFPECEAHL